MFLANKLNKGAGAPAPKDAQFNYVTMLLHGDGTNGAQNNTFLDSSTNNFTITRNGNTTQGSFSPYGSNWGVYFGGVGNYLTTATSASGFSFGTSDFTVEFWINSTQTTRCDPVGQDTLFTASGWWGFIFNLSGSGNMAWYENANSRISASGTNWNNGQWNHVALTRSGNSVRMFLNGTQVGSTYTTSFTYGASSVGIINGVISDGKTDGAMTGYLSNVRIVKGTAVYTSSFTPSTTPLTAISGTSLLTNQSNRFIDNSSNALAITRTGSPSVQRFNPFGASAAYSTSVIGGSGYFDGSGDTLDVPTSTNNAIGTGSFCIEAWIYMQNASAQQFLVANASSGGLFIGFNIDTANRLAIGRVATAIDNEVTFTWVNNQWYHVVVNRNGTSLQFFVNGVQVGSTGSNSVNYSNQGYRVGSETTQKYFTGYMTDFRLTRDSVYTTTFTPNTTPLTAITNTAVLLKMTNGAIFDNAMMNDLETVGNAQISTSVVKYGTGSLAFDGTGDYLVSNVASTDLYAFGTGDFTIEFWLYLNSVSGYIVPYDGRASGANSTTPTIYLFSAIPRYYVNGADRITGSTLSTGQWYHIAVSRSGTSTKLFVNGTQVGSTYTDSTVYTNTINRPIIGGDGNAPNTNLVNGYMDDVRITKGYARYTANFTPPTAALPDIGPN